MSITICDPAGEGFCGLIHGDAGNGSKDVDESATVASEAETGADGESSQTPVVTWELTTYSSDQPHDLVARFQIGEDADYGTHLAR